MDKVLRLILRLSMYVSSFLVPPSVRSVWPNQASPGASRRLQVSGGYAATGTLITWGCHVYLPSPPDWEPLESRARSYSWLYL